MTHPTVPEPLLVPPEPGFNRDAAALAQDLRDVVDGEVRFDAGSRAAYSTDASNYRQVPIGVVVPRTVEAAVAAVEVCRRHGAPIVSRGGGTSLAGQATNIAVVLDWSKYCHRLLEVDPDERTCLVEPGIVLDTLNERLRDTGLEFGPRPSTHSNCTIGGMIGNNACGATAQRTGKVVDNVVELEVLLYDGTRMWVGPTPRDRFAQIQSAGGRRATIYGQLAALRDRYLEQIRTGYADIPRRVSGYNLDSLLPEKNFDMAQALVGSEGSLVTVLRARLKLVPVVKENVLVLLGYPDIAAAADAVPHLLPAEPVALEAMDSKLIDFQRRKHLNPMAIRHLPGKGAWLMAQMGADTTEQARHAAERLVQAAQENSDPNVDVHVEVLDEPERRQEMWEIRESGLGATARVPGLPDTWPGWEDSAVAPQRLGEYLRDLKGLLREFGYEEAASMYGHFGQGCVHTRIPFDLTTETGVGDFRTFLQRAADLVVSHGGSLSGEHGDGRARGELLTRMFGPELTRAFGELKAIFDPHDRMNPGKVCPPYPLDSFLKLGTGWRDSATATNFAYPEDEGSFARAVQRCGRGQVPPRGQRGDVSVLYGHSRGGALHPRPCPAAVRDARRDAPRRHDQ